jgi:hypothetical protein
MITRTCVVQPYGRGVKKCFQMIARLASSKVFSLANIRKQLRVRGGRISERKKKKTNTCQVFNHQA